MRVEKFSVLRETTVLQLFRQKRVMTEWRQHLLTFARSRKATFNRSRILILFYLGGDWKFLALVWVYSYRINRFNRKLHWTSIICYLYRCWFCNQHTCLYLVQMSRWSTCWKTMVTNWYTSWSKNYWRNVQTSSLPKARRKFNVLSIERQIRQKSPSSLMQIMIEF